MEVETELKKQQIKCTPVMDTWTVMSSSKVLQILLGGEKNDAHVICLIVYIYYCIMT